MTDIDVAGVMDLLDKFYPAFYAKRTDAERVEIADLWAVVFERDDPRLVVAAVRSFIEMDEKGFPPVPGQIKAKLRIIMAHGELSDAEAWRMVRKAVRNSGYESQEEFERLPPPIQKLVGSPNQLREWALMDSDTLNSVVASNFLKAYRTQTAREREYNALPPDVRELAARIAAPEAHWELPEKKPKTPPKIEPIAKRPERIRNIAKALREGRAPDAGAGKGGAQNGE